MRGSLLVRKRKKLFLLPPEKWFFKCYDDVIDYYEKKPFDGKMYLNDVIGEVNERTIKLKHLLFSYEQKAWIPMIWSDISRGWVPGMADDVKLYIKEHSLIIHERPLI